jgi:PAS domain S-box-containing protein
VYNQEELMAIRNIGLISLLLIFGSLSDFMLAQEPVVLNDTQNKYPLGSHLEILEDPSGYLSIFDIIYGEFNEKFIPNHKNVPAFGYSPSAWWIRFKIRNDTESSRRAPWILELGSATINYADLYQISDEGALITEKKTGNMLPIDSRDHIYNRFAYLLNFPQQSTQMVYMRFQSEDALILPLTLYSMTEFMKNSRVNNLLMGIYIGIFFIMIGYNVFLFYSLKDKGYLYFAVFLVNFLLFALCYNGTAYLYLWPDWIQWNHLSILVFIGLMLISFWTFTSTFLQTKNRMKWIHRLISPVLYLSGFFIISMSFINYPFMTSHIPHIVITYAVIVFVLGFLSWKQGFRPAIYYLVSMFIFLFSAIMLSLVQLGFLPSNNFTESAYIVGSVPFLWLMSQALGDRVALLREEKEKADRNLKESETSLRVFIDALPEPAFLMDKNMTVLVANHALAHGYKKTIDAIIGQNAFSFIPPEAGDSRRKAIEKILKTGEPEIFEDTRDSRTYLNYIYPVHDSKGKVTRIAMFALDITQRKRSETLQQAMFNIANAVTQTQQMSELYTVIHQELSRLIDTTNFFVGLYEKETDSITLPYMKDEFDQFEKVPAANTISALVIKNNQSLLLHEKDMQKLQEEGKIGSVGSDSKIWLGVPLTVDEDVIGVLVVQSYDNEKAYDESDLALLEFVSRQIAVSIKRKQSEEQIRILSRALEQSSALVIITDLQGNIQYVNQKFSEVTGYGPEEVKGKNPRVLKSGETPPEVYRELWETIVSGREWRGELRNRKKNGELFWLFAYISSIKNERGEISHFLAINEDITERKLLQQQLLQSQKMESIGTLAGGIAHDFNNLLTVIKGYSELALSKLNDSHPLQKDLMAVYSASERAENLTRQILAFSRKQIIQPRIVDINQIINSSNTMLRRIIGEDIDIRMNLAPDLPRIKADPGQIEQILINLIVNARDAILLKEDSSGEKKIIIQTGQTFLDESYVARHMGSSTGYYTIFSVSDDGIGMTEEVKQQIFEPFFTTKGKEKGTGLGLATVYGIVKQNNGYIWVYSEPGEGTTFKIYWPVTDEELTVIGSQEKSAPEFSGKESILMVEDDKSVRDFTSAVLRGFGYKVNAAEDGQSALEQLSKNGYKPDLLITDLVMPGMNGKELAEKIKEMKPNIKILFTSGYTDSHIVRGGELEKDLNFLQKPYSIPELMSKVRQILDVTDNKKN